MVSPGVTRFADAFRSLGFARVRVSASGARFALCGRCGILVRPCAARLADAFRSLGFARVRVLANAASFALDSDDAYLILVLTV